MDVDVRCKVWIIVLLLVAGSGCKSQPNPSIELLESELRWMEDQLYAMDYELSQRCAQLDSCRRDNSSLRQQVEQGAQNPATSATPSDNSATNLQPPAATSPSVPVPDLDELDENLEIPDVDLGPDVDLQWSPDIDEGPSDPIIPIPSDDDTNLPSTDSAGYPQVERIVLNRRLTGGYNFDNHPGDEGLMVVIEPRDNAGNYVPLPGDISIVVTDANQPNTMAPVAQWVYFAEETIPFLKESLIGKGIHLQLPWPNGPPVTTRLRVQVTYKSPTSQTLTAGHHVHVNRLARGHVRNTVNNVANRHHRMPNFGVPNFGMPNQRRTAVSTPSIGARLGRLVPRGIKPPTLPNYRPRTRQATRPTRNLPATW